jgi:hypothetical protein
MDPDVAPCSESGDADELVKTISGSGSGWKVGPDAVVPVTAAAGSTTSAMVSGPGAACDALTIEKVAAVPATRMPAVTAATMIEPLRSMAVPSINPMKCTR